MRELLAFWARSDRPPDRGGEAVIALYVGFGGTALWHIISDGPGSPAYPVHVAVVMMSVARILELVLLRAFGKADK